jgi:hypothetical protein
VKFPFLSSIEDFQFDKYFKKVFFKKSNLGSSTDVYGARKGFDLCTVAAGQNYSNN